MHSAYNAVRSSPGKEDFRNIVSHGQNEDGSMWYVVSGRDPKTGRVWPRSGPKVIVTHHTYCHKCEKEDCGHFDTIRELERVLESELVDYIKEKLPWLEFGAKTYACSCTGFDETAEECIDILSLKHFEEELNTKKEGFAVQRSDEIKALQAKIERLESEKKLHLGEKVSLDEEIENLRLVIKHKEEESKQIVEILEENERLEKEKARAEEDKLKAVGLAQTLREKRFARLYKLPEEIQSHILVLAKFEPGQIKEALSPFTYEGIPHSNKEPKDKIKLTKIEHHRPRQFMDFVYTVAKIHTIDLITDSWEDSAKITRIKGIYRPEQSLPNGQKNNQWTIHMVYSDGDFGENLYLQTTARDKEEADLIKDRVRKEI